MLKPISPTFKTDCNSHFITLDENTGEAHYGSIKPGSPATYSNVLRIGIPLSYLLREEYTRVCGQSNTSPPTIVCCKSGTSQIFSDEKEQEVHLHSKQFKSKRRRIQTSHKKQLKQKRKSHKVKHFREKNRDEDCGELVQLQDTQIVKQYIRGLSSRVFRDRYNRRLSFPEREDPEFDKLLFDCDVHETRFEDPLGQWSLSKKPARSRGTSFLLDHYENRLMITLCHIYTYDLYVYGPHDWNDLWIATIGLNVDVRVDVWSSMDYGPYKLVVEDVCELKKVTDAMDRVGIALNDAMDRVAYDTRLNEDMKEDMKYAMDRVMDRVAYDTRLKEDMKKLCELNKLYPSI